MIEAFWRRARRYATALTFGALALARAPAPTLAAAAVAPPPATGGHVTLLQSSSSSPRARRCLTRIREELASGGFEVTTSEFGGGGEAGWMVDPPNAGDDSIATVTLLGDPDQGPAELWIVDGVPWGRVVVRRLSLSAGAGPHDDEVLAVRTLEFLRASAMKLSGGVPASTAPPASPASSTPWSAPPSGPSSAPSPPAETLSTQAVEGGGPPARSAPMGPVSVEVGASLIASSRDLGPAFLPVARLRAEWLSLLETRLTVAGFGTQPRVTGAEGSTTVGHLEGLVELRTVFRHGRAVRPAVGMGGGVLRVNVDGAANTPYAGIHERWVGLFDVGAGVTVKLGWRIAVAVEVHGQLAAPYPSIEFAGREVAKIGRPALFSSVTLVVPL
ncbi:MAG: hypothetical protein ABJA82_06090 [Myxococcales bacterium]